MARYHLVKNNCNHFSEAFLWALDEEFNIKPVKLQTEAAAAEARRTGASTIPKPKLPERTLFLPAYINRAARFGSYMAPNAVIKALSRGAPTAEVPDDVPRSQPASAPPPQQQNTRGTSNAGTNRASAKQGAGPSQEELRKQHPLPNDRAALERMAARELRTAMSAHGVDTTGCIEKADYVDAVLRHHADRGTPAGGSL